MANLNFPHGFRPLMVDLAGGPVGVNQYAKKANNAAAIFIWDLVIKAATSENVDGQNIPTAGCALFAVPGTDQPLGSSLSYGAPSTASLHLVVDDPLAIFEAQCSGAVSMSVASHVGKNANALATAQTNGTLLSAMQVNSAAFNNTTTDDLRIRDLYRNVSNAEGANAIVEVLLLNHANKPGSAGV